MQPRTIRLPESVWERAEEESLKQGISCAHWIRDVLLLHIARLDHPERAKDDP